MKNAELFIQERDAAQMEPLKFTARGEPKKDAPDCIMGN